MFAQAGINTSSARIVFYARLSPWGKSGTVWAYLFRWPCGDRAWVSRRFGVLWPHRVHIENVIRWWPREYIRGEFGAVYFQIDSLK